MNRFPSSLFAAAGLIGGYAVAASTGNRPLGGVVLALGGATAGVLWYQRASKPAATALVVTYVAAFGLSHVLAKQIGAWPSVLSVTVVTAAAAWVVADKPTAPVAIRGTS